MAARQIVCMCHTLGAPRSAVLVPLILTGREFGAREGLDSVNLFVEEVDLVNLTTTSLLHRATWCCMRRVATRV
jgi:hypothetical protein